MKVKVIGNYMHIIMDISTVDMKKARSYNEDSLSAFEEKDGEKVPVFMVRFCTGNKQTLSRYGANIEKDCIVCEKNEQIKYGAQIDIELPPCLTQIQYSEYIAENYSSAISYLEIVEKQVEEALKERNKTVSEVSNMVEFENLKGKDEGEIIYD